MDDQAPVGESETRFVSGPRVPDEVVRSELKATLEADDSFLGEVFRRREAGETVPELRADIGDFAWNYDRGIRAALEGDLPTSPGVIRGLPASSAGCSGRRPDCYPRPKSYCGTTSQ